MPPAESQVAQTNKDAGRPDVAVPPRWWPAGVRMVIVLVVVIAVGLITARLLVGQLRPHLYAGTVLQQTEPAPPLDGLRFASGEPIDLQAFDEEVVLVFFGYTNCPDVCPLTLSTVSRSLDLMGQDDRDRINLMMVSVDPDRDELSSLQEYVGFFDSSFRGVGGSQEAIDQAATLYGVFYELRRTERDGGAVTGDSYLVDHTASLMGIGPDGSLRVVWAPDVTAEALAADLRELLP